MQDPTPNTGSVTPEPTPTALTIAGFDPGSGAGISADLLTFARHGIFGTAAVTALTVQSTRGVRRVEPVDAGLLAETLTDLEADLPALGIKIGMLAGAPQARAVAHFVCAVRDRRAVTVVLDPVLVSSSGAVLLDAEGMGVLQAELLPLVDALTPNLREAEVLTGLPCGDVPEAEAAAARLAERYPRAAVVITGGHRRPPADLLWVDGAATWIAGEWIDSRATHGTGCVFSSSLLASRLLGSDWKEAALRAKHFVVDAIRTAPPRGSGFGPMNLVASMPPR